MPTTTKTANASTAPLASPNGTNGHHAVLLPYQRRWVAEQAQVAICAKSRQIGISWCTAAWSVREAAHARGHSVYYVSYRHDVGRQFIDDVIAWADGLRAVATRAETVVRDPDGDYLAYSVRFASGHEVVALPGRPRALRSRRGHVVIDEAAHLDDLPAMIDAALAMLIWGHSIRIVSTQLGEGSFYQALMEAPARGWAVHVTPFADAIRDGMFQVVARRSGKQWTQEAQDAWEADVRRQYGDRAAQELDCIPEESGADSRVLPARLIHQCVAAEAELPADDRPQVGFDVSGDGRDRGCLVAKTGTVVTHVELLHGDTIPQAKRAHEFCLEIGASLLNVDAGGPGLAAAAWIRGLKDDGHDVPYAMREVLFGAPPGGRKTRFSAGTTNGQQFARRNAQLGWAVRQHVVVDAPDLVILESAPKNLGMAQYLAQLSQPTWDRDSAQRVRVDKGEPSPDASDATVLAFAEESRRGLRVPGYSPAPSFATFEMRM